MMRKCKSCFIAFPKEEQTCPHCGRERDYVVDKGQQLEAEFNFAGFCLIVGQIISVLGCLAAIFSFFNYISYNPSNNIWPFVICVVAFIYSCAMLIVFKRVRKL